MEEREKKPCTAILLAGGKGRRLGSDRPKQYLEIGGHPLIVYSLQCLEQSPLIDQVILVAGKDEVEWVKEKIVRAYDCSKVADVVPGGRERYESVWNGLKRVEKKEGYVFIHDGARPFLTEEILRRGYDSVLRWDACVAGMPSKDTVKLVNEEQVAETTPERERVWTIQTPQVFSYPLIFQAYESLMQKEEIRVTDDAMVVEEELGKNVKVFEGSYRNIKVTTAEDLEIAEVFLGEKGGKTGSDERKRL